MSAAPPWFVILPIALAAFVIAYVNSGRALSGVDDAWKYRISYALISTLGAAWLVSQGWALLSAQ